MILNFPPSPGPLLSSLRARSLSLSQTHSQKHYFFVFKILFFFFTFLVESFLYMRDHSLLDRSLFLFVFFFLKDHKKPIFHSEDVAKREREKVELIFFFFLHLKFRKKIK